MSRTSKYGSRMVTVRRPAQRWAATNSGMTSRARSLLSCTTPGACNASYNSLSVRASALSCPSSVGSACKPFSSCATACAPLLRHCATLKLWTPRARCAWDRWQSDTRCRRRMLLLQNLESLLFRNPCASGEEAPIWCTPPGACVGAQAGGGARDFKCFMRQCVKMTADLLPQSFHPPAAHRCLGTRVASRIPMED